MLLLFWRRSSVLADPLVDPLTTYVFSGTEENQVLDFVLEVDGEDPSTQYFTQEKERQTSYKHGGGK